MSGSHVLVVGLEPAQQQRLDTGELVLPEHLDHHTYTIVCTDPENCHGWQECLKEHVCEHGCNAREGFEENDPDGKECPGHRKKLPDLSAVGYPTEFSLNCWIGEEDFDFHGEGHTYRYGWGWTVRWKGCVVADNDWELDQDRDNLPRGSYDVDDDWDDEWCTLTVTTWPLQTGVLDTVPHSGQR